MRFSSQVASLGTKCYILGMETVNPIVFNCNDLTRRRVHKVLGQSSAVPDVLKAMRDEKIRFNTDIARRKFTPADLVALATSLSGCGETTEETPQLCGTDAQCILTGDGRAALVDEFFNRLRNHVANATVNCYI